MTVNHILIADDEPEILAAVQKVFEENGFQTLIGRNGLEAWDRLVQHPHEVAACVVDLQMPPGQTGGRDLVARIRTSYSKTVPIAVYSGRGTVTLSHEVTKAGADAFVEKEDGPELLLGVVARLIAGRVRPVLPPRFSLQELARHADLPSLAMAAFRDVERSVREVLSQHFAPRQLHSLLSKSKTPPPDSILDKLIVVDAFNGDAKFSLGDLLTLLSAVSMGQHLKLPAAKQLSSLATQIVPVRNSLFHGREVGARELVVALTASHDLIRLLRDQP